MSFGGRVTGAVSGKTSSLLVGSAPGAKKVGEATSKGVRMLDVAGFKAALETPGARISDAPPPRITSFSKGYKGNGLGGHIQDVEYTTALGGGPGDAAAAAATSAATAAAAAAPKPPKQAKAKAKAKAAAPPGGGDDEEPVAGDDDAGEEDKDYGSEVSSVGRGCGCGAGPRRRLLPP